METAELSRGAITEDLGPDAYVNRLEPPRFVPAETAQPGPHIQVSGPEGTHVVPLDDGVLHVGRGLTADLYLDDASISRRQAIIVPHGAGRRILDDRSMNGTIVNGRRIEQADLHDGDVISLGHFELTYHEA